MSNVALIHVIKDAFTVGFKDLVVSLLGFSGYEKHSAPAVLCFGVVYIPITSASKEPCPGLSTEESNCMWLKLKNYIGHKFW